MPYTRFNAEDLILRDELAIDRTLLANERTLLAYLRSAVGLVIAGASIIHFAPQGWFWAFGIACIPAAILSALIGIVRYRRMNAAIAGVRKNAAPQNPSVSSGSPREVPRPRTGD